MGAYTNCTLAVYTKDADVIIRSLKENGGEDLDGLEKKIYENGLYTVLTYSAYNYFDNFWAPTRKLIDQMPHSIICVEEDGSQTREVYYEDDDDEEFEYILESSVKIDVSLKEDSKTPVDRDKVDSFAASIGQVLDKTEEDCGKLTPDEFELLIKCLKEKHGRKDSLVSEIPADQMKQTLYNLYVDKANNDGEEPEKFATFLIGRYLNPDSMFYLIDGTDHEKPLGQDKNDDAWKLWVSYCIDTGIDPE